MMRGQMFIVTAAIICILIASIANNYYYTDLQAREKFNDISAPNAMKENMQAEIGTVVIMDPTNSTRIGNFTLWLMNESMKLGMEMGIEG